MRVRFSSLRSSGVISLVDSMSSPDLIILLHSAEVAINSILEHTGPAVESVIAFPGSACCRAAVAIAQLAEHQIVDLGVAGSSPASHPSNSATLKRCHRSNSD